jgi:hypothetical protein
MPELLSAVLKHQQTVKSALWLRLFHIFDVIEDTAIPVIAWF